MPLTIPIPKLLQDNVARQLNNTMIEKNQSFVFLGEPEALINKTPSTYAEAFDQYVTRLYVLYHDYGMYYIKSYGNVAIAFTRNRKYDLHINFINLSRTAISHSEDIYTNDAIYSKLKNYYFKNDNSFSYNDWFSFWHNAPEHHWEKLVKKIIKDSDEFYTKFLCKIASHETNLKSLYKEITNIFLTGEYTDFKGNKIEIYNKSFDYRFLKIICQKLDSSVSWSDNQIARRELKNFYEQKVFSDTEIDILHSKGKITPQELKMKTITTIINSMKKRNCNDSAILYQSIIQEIEMLIKEQINAENISAAEDLLEP